MDEKEQILYIEVTDEVKENFETIVRYYGTWEKFGLEVGSDPSWLRRMVECDYVKERNLDNVFSKAGFPHFMARFDAYPLSVIQQRIKERKVNAR